MPSGSPSSCPKPRAASGWRTHSTPIRPFPRLRGCWRGISGRSDRSSWRLPPTTPDRARCRGTEAYHPMPKRKRTSAGYWRWRVGPRRGCRVSAEYACFRCVMTPRPRSGQAAARFQPSDIVRSTKRPRVSSTRRSTISIPSSRTMSARSPALLGLLLLTGRFIIAVNIEVMKIFVLVILEVPHLKRYGHDDQ